jgi:phosphate starvation-inducible PhoH-like protein
MQQKKKTRRERVEQGSSPRPQAQKWSEQFGINKIHLTDTQKTCRNKILENDLTFIVGSSGSGKTMTVLYTFIQEYLRDPTKQIIIIRTPVEAGMDKIGALPNTLEEKCEPHFNSTKTILQDLLSKGKVETDLGHRLHFKIPNYVLGSTFDNTLLLIDEAQQLPPLILKLIMERAGVNTKVCVLGDNSQLYVDSKGRNALRDAVPRFFREDGSAKFKSVAYHEFTVEDVVRSELTKTIIKAYA